jgi:kynurenine/2-aminoadipate aminotransferase
MAATIPAMARRTVMSGADFTPFFSAETLARKPSPIRALQVFFSFSLLSPRLTVFLQKPLVNLPGMISLGGGMPNPSTFPIAGLSMTLADGTSLALTPTETEEALQYSPTPGLPGLTAFLEHFQKTRHAVPAAIAGNTKVAVTTGSQDALAKAFSMLLGPEASLLVETPTYSGSLAYLQPMGVHMAGIPTDAHGLVPDVLAHVLDNWDTLHPRKCKPKSLCVRAWGIPRRCRY